MQSRSVAIPDLALKADLVHETVYTTKVVGKDLDQLIASVVMAQIGVPVIGKPGVTWSISHRSETTATEGPRQIAEVTIVVDHRTDAVPNVSTVQVRPGDMVVLPPGHHWLDMTSLDGGVAYTPVADAAPQ